MKFKNIFLVVVALALALSGTSSFPAQNRQVNRLTGTYRLNTSRSDSPVAIADRVSRNLPLGRQERLRNAVLRRLDAPESLVFDVQGRMVTMASTHSNLVTIDADGRANTEMSRNGRSQRTTAALYPEAGGQYQRRQIHRLPGHFRSDRLWKKPAGDTQYYR